jgi:hypothetical protein
MLRASMDRMIFSANPQARGRRLYPARRKTRSTAVQNERRKMLAEREAGRDCETGSDARSIDSCQELLYHTRHEHPGRQCVQRGLDNFLK